jgi:hypothetical protein
MIKTEEYCDPEIVDFLGEIIIDIRVDGNENEIYFETLDGQTVVMYHEQDCCEDVSIEDICGDLEDLLDSPIILAEEVANKNDSPKDEENDDSWTWTFYKLGTNRGSVTFRWYGVSNGYYSESVNFRLED